MAMMQRTTPWTDYKELSITLKINGQTMQPFAGTRKTIACMDTTTQSNQGENVWTQAKLESGAVNETLHSTSRTASNVQDLTDIKDIEKAAALKSPATNEAGSGTEKTQPAGTTSSEKPYSAFTSKEKVLIVLCATMGGLFSPFTTNIYFPALDTISSDLHVSISKVNLSITTYMIFQAITPTFVSTLTDTQGRRPAYVVGFIIYICANIGLALNNTYAGLMVLRCLQAAGSSGMVTLQQAIIADVITSAERGSYIAITSVTSIVAPSVAPIIGGVLSQHLGWHWLFWFLLILAGIYLVPMLLFMPETSRKLVDDGSVLPPRWNMSLLNVWKSHKRHRSGGPEAQTAPKRAKRKALKWPDPRPVLVLFLDKERVMILFFVSVAYAAFYAISSSLTVQFGRIYGLSTTLQGLLFIPQAVGSIFAAVTNSIMLDKMYNHYAVKHGVDPGKKKQINLAGFPIEKARLNLALPFMAANCGFMLVYGWMLNYEVNIAGPIVMLVFISYTMMSSFNGFSALNIDVNRHNAASASAASNLSRCLFGAGMTALINPMIEAMGLGWCFTFLALVQLCLLPGMWACIKYGVKWRAEKAEKESRKEVVQHRD